MATHLAVFPLKGSQRYDVSFATLELDALSALLGVACLPSDVPRSWTDRPAGIVGVSASPFQAAAVARRCISFELYELWSGLPLAPKTVGPVGKRDADNLQCSVNAIGEAVRDRVAALSLSSPYHVRVLEAGNTRRTTRKQKRNLTAHLPFPATAVWGDEWGEGKAEGMVEPVSAGRGREEVQLVLLLAPAGLFFLRRVGRVGVEARAQAPVSRGRGGTALRSDLAQLCCNLAKVSSSSLVLDPFVGRGSVLEAARHVGCRACFGSDIDLAELKRGVQGGSPHLVAAANTFSLPWRLAFDAIVCDPPFGLREPLFDARGAHWTLKMVPQEEKMAAARTVLAPLFAFAASCLPAGGRLVFIWPNFEGGPNLGAGRRAWDLGDLNLPEGLQVVGCAEQRFAKASGHVLIRVCVVIQKFNQSSPS